MILTQFARRLAAFVLVMTLASMIPTMSRAEESSILAGATTSQLKIAMAPSENLIDGNFILLAHSDGDNAHSGSKELTIYLSSEKKIVSAFVVNRPDNHGIQARMGKTAIFAGNDKSYLSSQLTQCSDFFFDTGIIKLAYNSPCQGTVVSVRRQGKSVGTGFYAYNLNELRLYQTPNLLEELTVTISAPAPLDAKWKATNLITNLGTRSSGNNLRPIVSDTGTVGSFESCYKTSNSQLSAEGNKMVITIDLGKEMFVHTIVLVQDLFTNPYVQNVDFYISNESVYTSYNVCPGGPYMIVNDHAKSYSSIKNQLGFHWNYGTEAWCNQPGRYVTVVADLTQLTGSYEMSICSLGIFGTKYERAHSIPLQLYLRPYDKHYKLKVDHITSALTIGNTLVIQVRIKDSANFAWIAVDCTPTSCEVTFTKNNLSGLQEVVLESYDDSSSVKSTLLKDKIQVCFDCITFSRQNTPATTYTMKQNSMQQISIENLKPSMIPQVEPVILMRQKAGKDWSFVKISEVGDYHVIDVSGATPGNYILVLESFDSTDPSKTAIQTDTITVVILPECQIKSEQIEDLQALLDKDAVKIKTYANNVAIQTQSFQGQLDLIDSELKLDEHAKSVCGGVPKVDLVTTHKFVTYDSTTAYIFLQSKEDTAVSSFSDSYLQVTIDRHQLKIPIEAEFEDCVITSLKFGKKSISFDYKIGSGFKTLKIPKITQEPDCQRKFSQFNILSIQSSLSKEQVLTAVLLDQSQLKVETQDSTFSGEKAEIIILAEQAFIDEDVTLTVKLSFSTEAPSFDMEGLQFTPLSCSESDKVWSTELPAIAGANDGLVQIQLNTDQDLTGLFSLTESHVLFLKSSSVQDFIESELCRGHYSVDLQFTLKSEQLGKSTEILSIPISNRDLYESEESTDTFGKNVTAIDLLMKDKEADSKKTLKIDLGSNIQEKLQRPKIQKMRLSSTSNLSINFERPIKPLPFDMDPTKPNRGLEEALLTINDAIELSVVGQKESLIGEGLDKSVTNISLKQANEKRVVIKIEFADINTLTQQLSEPDLLRVTIIKPEIFIDAETGLELKQLEHDILIKPQFTEEDFKMISEQVETAVKVGLTFTLIEIALLFITKKLIFSMRVLILTLQFFVYIACWQIKYPHNVKFMIFEFRRIALGEFFDDFDFGKEVANFFGLQTSEDTAADYIVGIERLGSDRTVIGSLGITQLLTLLALLFLILLVVIAVIIRKRVKLSEKLSKVIEKVESYIFYNPIIRYILLNSIKLNFMAFIVFKPPIGGPGDIFLAVIILVLITCAPLFFFYLLRKNRDRLSEEKQRKVFGALYQDKNIQKQAEHDYIYLLTFFYRRTLFVVVTVFLFDYPTIQSLANILLSFSALIYLFSDRHQYDTKQQQMIEICTEGLFYSAALFLAQLNDNWDSPESQTAIEDFTLACISLMITLNICFLIWNVIQNFKAKKRQKLVDRKLKTQQVYQQSVEQVLANPSILPDKLDPISEKEEEDGSSQFPSSYSQSRDSFANLLQSKESRSDILSKHTSSHKPSKRLQPQSEDSNHMLGNLPSQEPSITEMQKELDEIVKDTDFVLTDKQRQGDKIALDIQEERLNALDISNFSEQTARSYKDDIAQGVGQDKQQQGEQKRTQSKAILGEKRHTLQQNNEENANAAESDLNLDEMSWEIDIILGRHAEKKS